MITVGFTGTQQGMTQAQATALSAYLKTAPGPWIGHHGDCIGADAQFDAIARQDKQFQHMVIRPMIGGGKRAFCRATDNDFLAPEKPPLERNTDIAKACDILLATPKEDHMVLRSGTWTTVRYALKLGKPVMVFVPNGTMVQWQI